jgi:hypothetical protein
MDRPLMQHGVGQLAELFAKSKADHKLLKQLEHELRYRQVPRAVALLAEVQAAMYGSAPKPAAPIDIAAGTPAAAAAAAPQPSLWDMPQSVTTPPATAPKAAAQPIAARPAAAPTEATAASRPAPAMPLEDAYRLLKATPESTWESIEQTRRLLVQATHPVKLQSMLEGKRSQALTEARRVNDAYATLSEARCAGR